jgi:hypothetical protein
MSLVAGTSTINHPLSADNAGGIAGTFDNLFCTLFISSIV